MVKRWINFVIFIGYFCYVATHNCDTDEDCDNGKICRMICKRTICSATCVTVNTLKNKHSKENRSSSEEPFTVEINPFDTLQRDDTNATPLTISEAELEAELKQQQQNFDTTLPVPTFEITSSTTFPTPPTPILDSTTSTTPIPLEASSPGQIPQPPGIDQHQSGYMPVPENITTTDTTTVFPPTTTVISNFIEPTEATSGGGGYDKGVDEFVQEAQDNNINFEEGSGSTLPVSAATMFTETPLSSFPFETTDSTWNNVTVTVAENITTNEIEEPLPNGVQGIPFETPNNNNECLPPQICEKNCGIFVDSNGCQVCQCLWLSIPCEVSSDCVEEGQFCDLGRCECVPGYVQDMLQSGICKPATDEIDLQNIAEVHSNSSSTSTSSTSLTTSGNLQTNKNYPQRSKRSQTSEKPQRMERLQWPGPCDSDSQCPASLYCIEGDCWHLPDKPLRGVLHQHQSDEIPKSFPLESDDVEASTTTPLPPDNLPLFDFKAFPRPPPSTTSSSRRIIDEDEYEEAKPPSLRPLDYDETSFLGEFGETFAVSTTTERPITRMIAVEPIFIKSKLKPKKVHRGVTSSSSSSHSNQHRHRKPHLEEILKPIPTSPASSSNFFISSSIKKQKQPLSFPKYRNPQVSAEGWKPMEPHKVTAKFRLPTTTPMDEMVKVYLDYPNRDRHPVRVEMEGAKYIMRDECSSDRQCGEKYVCCEKRWCDLSRDCGKANFCLPNCRSTKMTHLSSTGIVGMPLIDLVYD